MHKRAKIMLASLAAVASLTTGVFTTGPASAATTTATTTPYGITLSGLQDGMNTAQIEAEIQAVADDWNANTVRLQVEQDKLVAASGTCLMTPGAVSSAYLTQIQTVVNYALSVGLNVVINDQTEGAPGYLGNEPAPTNVTERFWGYIAPIWAGNPHVTFDMFNEPRGDSLSDPNSANTWNLWRNGGAFADGCTYLGEQDILSYIRNLPGVTNPVWVEGPDDAASLAGILTGPHTPGIAGDQLSDPLHDLTYTFHHPYPDANGQDTTAWWRDFGYIIEHFTGYRVADGEFNNAVDPLSSTSGQYCWTPGGPASQQLPALWPAYQAYLTAKNIGMTGWTLGPVATIDNVPDMPVTANANGRLITSDITGTTSYSLSAPTSYGPDNSLAYATPATEQGNPPEAWNCGNDNNASVGQDMETWYSTQTG